MVGGLLFLFIPPEWLHSAQNYYFNQTTTSVVIQHNESSTKHLKQFQQFVEFMKSLVFDRFTQEVQPVEKKEDFVICSSCFRYEHCFGAKREMESSIAAWQMARRSTKPVEWIESNAFYSSKMVSILIPSTVAEIEKGAFDYCSNLKTIYVSENDTARVKEMMRGMMNIVNGKSVEMNVDDWEFIEISAVEFSTAESVAEVFGDGSAMAECVKDPTQLAAFNTFISDCGITSVESISAAQKQYAYQSFKLAEITTAPRLFEEEPVLKIDDLELSAEEMSFTISLTAGSEAIELAYEKLAQKIRVGTSLDSIVAPPEINPRPSADGTSLTFTISKPEGNQGFVKVQID